MKLTERRDEVKKRKEIKPKKYIVTDPRLFGCEVWEAYDDDGFIIYRQIVKNVTRQR